MGFQNNATRTDQPGPPLASDSSAARTLLPTLLNRWAQTFMLNPSFHLCPLSLKRTSALETSGR